MWKRIVQAGLFVLAFTAAPAAWAIADPAGVHTNLNVPPQNVRHLTAYAAGAQVYVCTAQTDNPYSFGWTFKEPVAELFDGRGEPVGTHYDGPTWEWHDGSAVVGQVIEREAAPTSGAVPWLLLRAISSRGDGRLVPVTYIQRIETTGGTAPLDGCNQAAADIEVAVPYTATYVFYTARDEAQ